MAQIDIYNGALLLCGERFLANLTEEREPRRLLDHVWANGGIKACLEEGQWNFAMRTVQVDYDPAMGPPFGYNRAFRKPTDWLNTSGLCSDEFFRLPLLRYIDEAGYWYADLDTIYVRYVSNDAQYGMDIAHWPDSFREFVESHFASKIVLKLSNSDKNYADLLEVRKMRLKHAKSRAAMAEPTTFPAQGNWSRARNRYPNRRDGGGTTGSLIG